MPLRLFKLDLINAHRRPPYVTVRSDGRLTFNAEASRALDAADLRRVRLFGDRQTKRVVIRPATTEGPETHLISYLKPTPTQIRATLEAKPFLSWLGYALAPQQPQQTSDARSSPSQRPAGSRTTSAIQRYQLYPLPRRSFEFTLAQPETLIPKPDPNSHEATA